jgi:uncharacterized repeat protein (TIGR04076 family)
VTLVLDTRIWPLTTKLASCLCAELAASGGPEPCFCGVLAGDSVAYDYCSPCQGDQCGMAWVRLASIIPMPSNTANSGLTLPGRCAPALVGIFEVGVLRCAPTLTEDGQLPDMAVQLAAAELQASDMAAAGRAAACCFTDGRIVTVGEWSPAGPIGGCLGGSWSVSVGEF